MSPLSFVLTIASIVFLFFAVDGMQRRKFHFLHFLIFFGGSMLILAFLFVPGFQSSFSRVFGVARGADLIVYATLIVLGYFYFELLHTVTKQKAETSRLISAEAIRAVTVHETPSHSYKDTFVFLMRAYNEGASIGKVIESIFAQGYSKIVVVNDGSNDTTIDIITALQSKYPDKTIYLLSHIINRGGGAANKTGLSFLKKHIDKIDVNRVVTFDADGQMDIADMETFIAHIQNPENIGVQAFLGTRFANGGSSTNMPGSRKVILRGSKIVTLLFNRLNVTDPHNGYRVLHKDILPKLAITSDGMMYASELLDSIRVHDIMYKEVPVHIMYTEYSLGKGQKNRNALRILGEIIYKKMFFK